MTDEPRADEDVPALWRSLGLPGIVDLHVHFMPRNVLDKVWAYFDGVGPLTGRPWPITYREDEDVRLARLRAMGVRAFPSLLYPHKPGMARWLNGWAAEFAARHDDVLHTATFYPEPDAGEYVAAALAGGARVWKAHIQVGGYDPRDPLLEPVWAQLEQAQVPVVVHCGHGPTRGPFTGADVFDVVLARHPDLVAVIAHMGLPDYAVFLDLAARYPRVHLDTTMAFTRWAEVAAPFPPELSSRLMTLRDRIVLGSDFPNIPYPYVEQLAGLVRLDLGDDWLRAVLHDNATRLLRLSEFEASRPTPDA
ncbi:MAG: amidohydrolase [Actinobacteria bacterium]|nr:amidohydrolase [Actinomycetota bacterium]MCA1722479.1 amidohydrolase [Actinomycetota bacterium]